MEIQYDPGASWSVRKQGSAPKTKGWEHVKGTQKQPEKAFSKQTCDSLTKINNVYGIIIQGIK